MASDFFNLISAGFSETLQVLDPTKAVTIIGPNGQSAQAIVSTFVQSETLKAADLENKLPAVVQMWATDFTRLAIVDRSEVMVAGHKLTVMAIGNDAADPTVQLTLTQLSLS